MDSNYNSPRKFIHKNNRSIRTHSFSAISKYDVGGFIHELLKINSRLSLFEEGGRVERALLDDNMNIFIPGRNHWERNLNYLAGHLSHTHAFNRDTQGRYIFSKNTEGRGYFYLQDNRPYPRKILSPLMEACEIVKVFLQLPVASAYIKAYETPHRSFIYEDTFSEEPTLKYFTHKIVIAKDFDTQDLTLFRNISHNAILPEQVLGSEGIGVAPVKVKLLGSTSVLVPTIRVTLIMQITKVLYQDIDWETISDPTVLQSLPITGNAFVLSLFPVCPS